MGYFPAITDPDKIRAIFVRLLHENEDRGVQALISKEYQETLRNAHGTQIEWGDKKYDYKYSTEKEVLIEETAKKAVEIVRGQSGLVEIIGTWVWITFPGKTGLGSELKALGFHFNGRRKVWQWKPFKGRFFASDAGKETLEQKYGKRIAA